MSRAALPTAYLRRIAHILAQHGQAGDESAGKAAAWLTEALEAQQCPSQVIRDLINSLRPEWEAFPVFDAEEEHNFRVNESDFKRLTSLEWDVIRDFLSYHPREGESFFQVEKRLWFLKAPEDTLTGARKWAWTHRKGPKFIPRAEASTHPDTPITELLAEVFKGAVWKE